MKEPVIVVVQIESDDPRLDLAKLDVSTVASALAWRQVIIDNLPKVTRVIGAFPVEHIRLLMQLHEAVGEDIAATLGEKVRGGFVRGPLAGRRHT